MGLQNVALLSKPKATLHLNLTFSNFVPGFSNFVRKSKIFPFCHFFVTLTQDFAILPLESLISSHFFVEKQKFFQKLDFLSFFTWSQQGILHMFAKYSLT